MILTYSRSLDLFPEPPGETADTSVAGDAFQDDFQRAGGHLQEFPSSRFTAVVCLGPGCGFPNKLKTSLSEDKLTHIWETPAWKGLRPFPRKQNSNWNP